MRFRTATAVALIVCGCTREPVYLPPATPEGAACAAECNKAREHCEAVERKEHLAAYLKCTAESQDARMRCVSSTQCPPVACSEPSDSAFCEGGYATCYRACGGSVTD